MPRRRDHHHRRDNRGMSGVPAPDPYLVNAVNQPILQYPVGSNPPAAMANPNPQPSMMSGYAQPASSGFPNVGYMGPGQPTSPPPAYPNEPPPTYFQSVPPPGFPNTGYVGPAHPTSPGFPGAGGCFNQPGAKSPPPTFNPPSSPSAPELGLIENIPGYEGLTFKEEPAMPPPVPEWQPDYDIRAQMEKLPSFTEEEVREAAVEYSNENCCYGSSAAENMVITNLNMMSAFRYKFETFTERRHSAWRFEPYNGQLIDGPMNGPAPQPWTIVVTPRYDFKSGNRRVEVPHTAFVKPCHKCVGNTRVRCEACKGNATFRCRTCNGRGRKQKHMCHSCNGAGMTRCRNCSGTAQVTCNICTGRGQLKAFVELTVTWTNHVEEFISETSSLPQDLVCEVNGMKALEEESPRVNPIMHTGDEALRKVSNDIVKKHNTAFRNERILRQRHLLTLIPIAQVNYVWNEKSGLFYVYGYERKAYFIKYPAQCTII